MSFIQKLKYQWHCYWYCHHEQLLRDCLDDGLKVKITNRIVYHRQKMFSV
ncbi:hypothetical protein [Ammoniphilus resinae]|uniref:Transposase n=1 Tax=Ammoniphilus resinae TaxID=861532 RepID=A0ABS4GU95_9BACL|nr:hypothetical protein [Ammoniphilus resinae]MBP1933824.1 hypothetical protein [Ammoniphilus resinae]